VSESIAGADHEIVEGIVGMEGRFICVGRDCGVGGGVAISGKLNGNEVACNLSGGPGESVSAVAAQELCAGVIWAGDFEQAASHSRKVQIIKPNACVDGVERFCTVEYIREYIFNIAGCQTILLYDTVPVNEKKLLHTGGIRANPMGEKKNTRCNITETIPGLNDEASVAGANGLVKTKHFLIREK